MNIWRKKLAKVSLPPQYTPNSWNSLGTIKNANCYAYVLDVPIRCWNNNSDDALTPGEISGVKTKVSKENIIALVSQDLDSLGWKYRIISNSIDKLPHEYVFGVLMWGKHRFHFIRKDSDGSWSSKPGLESAVQKIDYYDGCPIMEFESNDRFFYDVVGFFAVSKDSS